MDCTIVLLKVEIGERQAPFLAHILSTFIVGYAKLSSGLSSVKAEDPKKGS